MLIAEDLLLLLTDDDSGKVPSAAAVDLGLAGALVADLDLAGRVRSTAGDHPLKKDRLEIRDSSPVGDALLDSALSKIASVAGRRPYKAVEALTKGTRRSLYERLAERGLVRQHESKVFGITLRTTWPAAERMHEQLLRARLSTAL